MSTLTTPSALAGDLRFTEAGMEVYNGNEWTQLVFDTGETGTPFEDYVPSLAQIETLCSDNPALKDAYEQFKLLYILTKSNK